MAACKLLTVLLLLHNTGGFLGAEVRSSIIGGKDSLKGQWPWMVHLNITTDNGLEKWRCGGTILNNFWLLTAGRCWDGQVNLIWRRVSVFIGAHALQQPAERYMGVRRVIRHTGYRRLINGYINDIALVQLKKKIQFSKLVSPVRLASGDDSFDSSSCWTTGWGKVGKVPLADPEILQEVQVEVLPPKECKATFPNLQDTMLCAGDRAGGKDSCNGDYGNPLVCQSDSGFVQVGIMSFGSSAGCGIQGHPSVYTKVSEYLPFINDYIHHEDASAEV
ncbi:chymotrypsin-1 [Austrofundulus limnaeus]|uniref:Chymotrypsin-1 n=1 Tax=Austrofundulus limnaeus TaxID=52670 RepID=A0A2I4CIB9_AUSLI|nr:PREDICTED: chymotrypsin-1-like [Austrofundulus limnaeus]